MRTKKCFTIILIGALLFNILSITNVNVYADTKQETKNCVQWEKLNDAIVLMIGRNNAYVNNIKMRIDCENVNVVPVTEEEKIFIPVRFVAENLGAKVDYNEKTSNMIITLNNKTIKIKLNSDKIIINDVEHKLNAPAKAFQNILMLSLEDLAKAFNKKVFYDNRGIIAISDKKTIFDKDSDDILLEAIARSLKFAPVQIPYNPEDKSFKECESFESDKILNVWQAKDKGSTKISKKHFKHGQSSLLWNWEDGSKLQAINPQYLEQASELKNGGIKAWVYNEKPVKDKLTFNFGTSEQLEAGNPKYTFDFNLNFEGWRALWVHFKEDALNDSYTGDKDIPANTIQVAPPSTLPSGRVFIDLVQFGDITKNCKRRCSDYQIPKSRTTFNDGKGGSWERSYYYSKQKPTIPLEDIISEEQIQSFKTITDRYNNWVLGDGDLDLSKEPIKIRYAALQAFIREGLERYEKLNIKVDEDGAITGIPLFAERSSHKPACGREVLAKVFLPVIYDYKINGNEASKEKALRLFDYVYDQGWAEGSAMGTLDHGTQRTSGYFHGILLMKDELKETGRLDKIVKSANWYLDFGKTFGKFGKDYTETTSDEMRTKMLYSLVYILAMEDSPQKVQYIKGWLNWMNSALKIAPGYSDTIKPDYLGFHHRGVYGNAYTPYAYDIAGLISYLLHDTVFDISDEGKENLKNALKTMDIISNEYDMPYGVCGRIIYNANGNILKTMPAYMYMALSEEGIDEEMAGTFMNQWKFAYSLLKDEFFPLCSSATVTYAHTLGEIDMMLDFIDKGYKPEETPEGFWMKPYGALAIHRRGDWMVSTKGWSQYVWDVESGTKKRENAYGRYVSYGSMEILAKGSPINHINNGYNIDAGWDWNRWPGATTKHLPFDNIWSEENNWAHRNFNDQTFVGGVSSENRNGIFAMKLHDTAYDKTFYANKSVFYFDNEIICLGSGIENKDAEHLTETTLFQSYMDTNEMPFLLNSKQPITKLPYETEISDGKTVWMMDPYGNGYIIPDAKDLHVKREVQKSKNYSGKNDTQGAYTTAWIDHGKQPSNEGYEYAILVQARPEDVKNYAQTQKYEVLKKDNKAHIVKHKKQNCIGYVIFDQNIDIPYGAVNKVDTPCIIMEKDKRNEIVLSVADPDLRMGKRTRSDGMPEEIVWQASQMHKLNVQVKGKWQLKNAVEGARVVNFDNGITTLEFDCVDGKTIEISLVKE